MMRMRNVSKIKIAVVVVGLALLLMFALNALLSGDERSGVSPDTLTVDIASYPADPERDVFVACTDEAMDPATVSVEPKTFVKVFFTNEGTVNQRFGIRFDSGKNIDSTRAIAPQTKANFSWRVPEETFTVQMYCSDHAEREDDLVGTLRVEAKL